MDKQTEMRRDRIEQFITLFIVVSVSVHVLYFTYSLLEICYNNCTLKSVIFTLTFILFTLTLYYPKCNFFLHFYFFLILILFHAFCCYLIFFVTFFSLFLQSFQTSGGTVLSTNWGEVSGQMRWDEMCCDVI